MSWSIDIVGKPEAVSAAIQKDTNIPQPLKDVVALFAKAAAADITKVIQVKTMGHFGETDSWSNMHEFSIKPVTLVQSV